MHFAAHQPAVAPDAVIDMHHEIARGQLVHRGDDLALRLLVPNLPPLFLPTQQFAVGQQRELRVGDDDSLAKLGAPYDDGSARRFPVRLRQGGLAGENGHVHPAHHLRHAVFLVGGGDHGVSIRKPARQIGLQLTGHDRIIHRRLAGEIDMRAIEQRGGRRRGGYQRGLVNLRHALYRRGGEAGIDAGRQQTDRDLGEARQLRQSVVERQIER